MAENGRYAVVTHERPARHTSFCCLSRYSLGEMPTYCLKYFPKKDWLEKFRRAEISLMLRSELSSNWRASVMTICTIHCNGVLPDFSLMMVEK